MYTIYYILYTIYYILYAIYTAIQKEVPIFSYAPSKIKIKKSYSFDRTNRCYRTTHASGASCENVCSAPGVFFPGFDPDPTDMH